MRFGSRRGLAHGLSRGKGLRPGPPGRRVAGPDPGTPMEHEERLAYLERAVDDLSETAARQDREIAILTRRVQLLMEREAEREAAQEGGVVIGDERPPHY